MTDINDQIARDEASRGGSNGPVYPGQSGPGAVEPELLELTELLFFAYRDFIGEPDAILAEFGFGRAHHRVLHFVNRHPGLRVADLLDILKITKQSLGRVLKQLVDEGYIVQEAGQEDRRERLLYATEHGKALAAQLAGSQLRRIAEALEDAGSGATQTVREFLYFMVAPEDRATVTNLLSSVTPRNDGDVKRS